MKKTMIGILILLVLITFSSMSFAVWGSGKLATEERTVPTFHSIELAGSGRVYLQQGNQQSLKVTTDHNLLTKLETDVFNGKLRIGFKHGVTHVTKLEVYITVKEIKGVIISGSGRIEGNGGFQADNLQIKISGSGDIAMDVNAKTVNAHISGSGNIDVRGEADEQKVEISGSGNYNGFNLATQKAYVVIRGSGNSKINVADELNIELYGSGNVDYKGRPQINSKSHGSGRIRSVN